VHQLPDGRKVPVSGGPDHTLPLCACVRQHHLPRHVVAIFRCSHPNACIVCINGQTGYKFVN